MAQIFHIKPFFQRVFDDFQTTQHPRCPFILERYKICNIFIVRPFFAFRQKSLFIAGRTRMRRVPKIKNKNIFLYQGCVIQHRNWTLRSTILNAHGTNASPDGLCTRTHTNESFSCWLCCNSFRVDRAKCRNVCLSSEGMLSYRSACPEI